MPAVVRIKRRIDEEPHTAFVLNGKRRRLQNDENSPAAIPDKDELSTVLKFAGTLEKQDDCATKQFAAARLNKASAKELVQQKFNSSGLGAGGVQRRDKLRQEAQQAAKEQRFRVVNCLRTTLDAQNANEPSSSNNATQLSQETAASLITIVDIESQAQRSSDATQPEQQQPADSDIGYVYDLYVPENEQQAAFVDMMDDNYLSVRAADEVIYEDCYQDAEEEYDSEDSNQENYYTNEYPDDDLAGSEDELCREMNKFQLMPDDDDDEDRDEIGQSSSEDEDYNTFHDPYMHSLDTEADAFVDDVDFCNVERQGSAYERYKRRLLREAEEGSDFEGHSDKDDDDDAPFESASEKGEEHSD